MFSFHRAVNLCDLNYLFELKLNTHKTSLWMNTLHVWMKEVNMHTHLSPSHCVAGRDWCLSIQRVVGIRTNIQTTAQPPRHTFADLARSAVVCFKETTLREDIATNTHIQYIYTGTPVHIKWYSIPVIQVDQCRFQASKPIKPQVEICTKTRRYYISLEAACSSSSTPCMTQHTRALVSACALSVSLFSCIESKNTQ